MPTDPYTEFDFKFIDPVKADEASVEKLANEAVQDSLDAWLQEIAAVTDDQRADAIVIPDLPKTADDDDFEDPHEEERTKKDRLHEGARLARERAEESRKAHARKKKKLQEKGKNIAPSDVKNAKKRFLVGTVEGNNFSGGWLAQQEQTLKNHMDKRIAALDSLAETGANALTETERVLLEEEVVRDEEAIDFYKALITNVRNELTSLGLSVPSKAGDSAPVGVPETRATKRNGGKAK